jgi:hypothetical protein
MYFCPKCNYSFDISKAIVNESEPDSRKPLSDPVDALKRLKADKDMSKYIAEFTMEELEENKHYKKLDDIMKDKMKVLFESHQSQFGGIEFKCNNCNYHKKIKETIMLYQLNINSVYSVYRSIDDNKLLTVNPIYPRTKDYVCKNINCLLIKMTLIKKLSFLEKKIYIKQIIFVVFVILDGKYKYNPYNPKD